MRRYAILGLLAFAGLATATLAGPARTALPPGIGIRLTLEGPIFVNAQGMSLYWRTDACNNDRETKVEPIAPEGGVSFTVLKQRTKKIRIGKANRRG